MDIILNLPLADMWNMHGDWGWGWGALMIAGMIAFWVLVVVAIIWLARGGLGSSGPQNPPSSQHPPESALDVLQRRLASGDISIEDYEERRRAIVGGPEPAAGQH